MVKVNRSRDITAAVRQHTHRIEDRERAIRTPGRTSEEEIIPFSASGAVAVTTAGEEPQWNVQRGGQIVAVSVHLKTAGSSSTVVTFYVDGVSIGTVTLASSATDASEYLGNHRAASGQKVSARVTTAGTGAKGLSAFVKLKG